MGNRKAKPLEAEMRVDSTADLQENAGDLLGAAHTHPSAIDACDSYGAHRDRENVDTLWNRHFASDGYGADGRRGSGSGGLPADGTTKQYEAVNLDEHGKFIQFGLLEVSPSEIIFYRMPNAESIAMTTPLRPDKRNKKKPKHTLPETMMCTQTSASGELPVGSETTSVSHAAPIRWPFHLLRRYGYDQDLFTIETGRRACTGAGVYAFQTNNAAELFFGLQQAIKQYSAGLLKKRETSATRIVRRTSTGRRTASDRRRFGEDGTGDFMHWSPRLHMQTQVVQPIDTQAQAQPQPQSQMQQTPPIVQQSETLHNYVNLSDKPLEESGPLTSKLDAVSLMDGEHPSECCTSATAVEAKKMQPAASANFVEERKYENLPALDESRADVFYINLSSMAADAIQMRDLNGHLPGCPCHRSSSSTNSHQMKGCEMPVGRCSSPANRQLNYVELDLRNCFRRATNNTNADHIARTNAAEGEDNTNTTSAGESTNPTKTALSTNSSCSNTQNASSAHGNVAGIGSGNGTGSSSPSATSSSVFSANGKVMQASSSFLGLSDSRQPLLGSGSIGSANGPSTALVLAKSGSQSRPNSDSLAQTHVCAVHTHVMKCNEHPLVKPSGSHRAIHYTQIDFERTTALTNSKKSLESAANKKMSVDTANAASLHTLHRRPTQKQDELTPKQASALTFGSSPPKAVSNMLVPELLKINRHN